jgi:hypothetical protein
MNKESLRKKAWKLKNSEREKQNNKRWYELNKLSVSARKAKYYQDNCEKEKTRSKLFYKQNPLAKRPKTPQQRATANIRSKISALVAGRYKRSKSIKYIRRSI